MCILGFRLAPSVKEGDAGVLHRSQRMAGKEYTFGEFRLRSLQTGRLRAVGPSPGENPVRPAGALSWNGRGTEIPSR